MASSLLAVLKTIAEAVGIFYFLLYRVEIERKPSILNVAEMKTVKDFPFLYSTRLRDPVHAGGPAALLPLGVSKMPYTLTTNSPFCWRSPQGFLLSTNKSPNHTTKGTLAKHALSNSSPFHYPRPFLGVLFLLLLSQLFQSQSPCPWKSGSLEL